MAAPGAAAGQGTYAGPDTVTITGAAGDVYYAVGGKVPAPESAAADLISASATDTGTTVSLSARTVAMDNPMTDPNWRNVTFIAWVLDPEFSGHPEYSVYFALDQSGNYAGSIYDNYTCAVVSCPVQLSFSSSAGYGDSFPASCLPGVTSFQWLVYSFYDPVATDTTGVDAFGKSLPDFHSGVAPFAGGVSGASTTAPVITDRAAPAVHAPTPTAYWLLGSNGAVYTFGSAHFYGSLGGRRISAPVVAMATTLDSRGYWLAGAVGAVYAFGDARPYGRVPKARLSSPVATITATPDGKGYWLATLNGAVYAFGDAHALASRSRPRLRGHVVGLQPTPDGKGYWLAMSTGAVYRYGDAPGLRQRAGSPPPYYGSETARHLVKPLVRMASSG
jgi:hypothetical protein